MKTVRKIGFAALSMCALLPASPAIASGFEAYVGEIILTPYNFCPRGYAAADGSILPLAQNTALFSLLGVNYGGNGVTTFGLPDLRGRVGIGTSGQGPGLSNYVAGQIGGTETNTLTTGQMPAHSHSVLLKTFPSNGNSGDPAGNHFANAFQDNDFSTAVTPPGTMAADTLQVLPAGGSQPVNNVQPVLGMQYCIATQGIFPPRP